MRNIRILPIIAILAFAVSFAYAQEPTPAVFTSVEGGFSIGLPEPKTITPYGQPDSSGKRYAWTTERGSFAVVSFDQAEEMNAKKYLEFASKLMIDTARKRGGKLEYQKKIRLGGLSGVEIKLVYKRPDGSETIYIERTYASASRVYSVNHSVWTAPIDPEVIKILDSFKIIATAAPPKPVN